MPQIISLNEINKHFISLTDFRRNAGRYINTLAQKGPYAILRGSKVVAELTAPVQSEPKLSTAQQIKKVRKLAGGFSLGINLTPEQINKEYDKMYDEMLPR
jgi:hypothetical protein